LRIAGSRSRRLLDSLMMGRRFPAAAHAAPRAEAAGCQCVFLQAE
jgi:hypothetical protein